MEKFNQEVYTKNMELYKKIDLEDEYHDFLIANNFDTTKKMSQTYAKLTKLNKSTGRHKQKNIIHLSTININGVDIDIFSQIAENNLNKCRLSDINFTNDEIQLIHYHINIKNSDNKPPFKRGKTAYLNSKILEKLENTI